MRYFVSMGALAKRISGVLVAALLVATAVQVGNAGASNVRPSVITLTPDPPGLTGSLHDIMKTPANEILGSDDRGLFKWTASSGWKLLLEPTTLPSCALSKKQVLCPDDPIRVGWGTPDAFPTSANSFIVIEPMGVTGDIAINESADGKMSDTWTTVNVDDHVFVQNVCGGGEDPDYPELLYATAYDTSNPEVGYVYESADNGTTWTKTDTDPMDFAFVCTYMGYSDDVYPSIDDVINAPNNPKPLGYLGPDIYGYVETPSVRMILTFGGLFASADGGDSWVPQSRGINVHPGLRLLYTRYGDTQIAGGYSEQESALFRSTDAGATFRRVGGAPALDPFTYVRLQSQTVAYAGYMGEDYSGPPRFGAIVYKSTDKGENWTPLNSDTLTFEYDWMTGGQFLDLVANGVQSSRVVAVLHSTGDKYYVTTSDDSGATWSEESEIVGCLPSAGEPYVNGNTMMVVAQNASAQRGYCRTTDAGAHWTFVNVGAGSQFEPGALITQPDGSLLALSAVQPLVSSDGGASFVEKVCEDTQVPIGPVVAGSFDETGALWVVYYDYTGEKYPNVYRSPDGGCTWDVTSVTNALDESVEDQVLDVEPDPDGVAGSSLHASAARTGSRTVRVIGVGKTGSSKMKIYWGPKPSAVRNLDASVSGQTLTVTFTAPATPGPGKLSYVSSCAAPKKKLSVVKGKKTVLVHKNLAKGAKYTCSVTAVNAMGSSAAKKVSRKIPK